MSLSRWMDLGGLEAGASLAGLGSVVCPVCGEERHLQQHLLPPKSHLGYTSITILLHTEIA